jgi:Ala-tRNA(Pro) deacylase
MANKRILDYLDSHGVYYSVIKHTMAFTAQEIAASVHISGHELAKTVIVKLDDRLAMAVLPASYKVNFGVLRDIIGSRNIELATEHDFMYRFPDCDLGAIPPFGNLWNMEVFISERLSLNEDIVFSAGSRVELIRMKYNDYEKLVAPKTMSYMLSYIK